MELQSCINYLLTTAQHEVFQTFSSGLAQFNITPGQYGVLSCLWQNGPSTPKEIAQTLRLENSTISGVLDRMQKRGLIDRVVDPNDRRSVQVVPTEEGSGLRLRNCLLGKAVQCAFSLPLAALLAGYVLG